MKHRATVLYALLSLGSVSVAGASETEKPPPDWALRFYPHLTGIIIAQAASDIEPGYNSGFGKLTLKSFDAQIMLAELATSRGDTKTDNIAGSAEVFNRPETNRSKSILDLTPSLDANEPMDPELAFQVSLNSIRHDALHARFYIHDCCYLYRDRFRFNLTGHDGEPAAKIRIGEFKLPRGKIKEDEFFGRTEVFYSGVAVILPILGDIASGTFGVQVTYQGCSEKGVIICYPPHTRYFTVVHEAGQFKVSGASNPQ